MFLTFIGENGFSVNDMKIIGWNKLDEFYFKLHHLRVPPKEQPSLKKIITWNVYCNMFLFMHLNKT